MTHDANPRVTGEHTLELFVRIGAAVGDHDHAGMDRIADADAAAVMHRHPGGAARRVQERIQNGPVRDGIAAVAHALGFTVRRRHRAGFEMVAADHDWRLEAAFAHELVEAEPETRALAVAKPEDPRRQPLERDALARHAD